MKYANFSLQKFGLFSTKPIYCWQVSEKLKIVVFDSYENNHLAGFCHKSIHKWSYLILSKELFQSVLDNKEPVEKIMKKIAAEATLLVFKEENG